MHRFYAPDLDPDRLVTLPPDEGEHLARVLRLRPGDEVAVFDGRGREMSAVVADVDRRGVRVQPTGPREAAPEPAVRVTLAAAVLKDRQVDDLVRDATMLGVAALQPIRSARTVAAVGGARAPRVLERWRRIAIASCKQCGRAVVPEVRPLVEFADLVEHDRHPLRLLLVEPAAATASLPESLRGRPIPDGATVAVGPEGGWTAEEVALAAARGFEPLRLGTRTLRAEAAPVVALAVLQFVWRDL